MCKFISLSSKSITDLDFDVIENKVGFKLPDDYKSFLKKYNGVTIDKQYICSFPIHWCSEKRDVLQGLYCIDSDLGDFSIDYWIDFYKKEIYYKNQFVMIPIGITMFGSPIFMKNNGKIILADFSRGFKSSIGSRCLYPITKSFGDFVNCLLFEK